MNTYEKILSQNSAWASKQVEKDPDFFNRLVEIQKPDFLWIGCSDSRVPADMITGTNPGEIFVHRNIANLVVNTDVNLLSVLDYAVTHLKVKHIIVCGHYGCGGVKAAASNTDYQPILNMWLSNIKEVLWENRAELDAIKDDGARADRLVELNVQKQVLNLAKTTIIQRSWKAGNSPDIHGWVYSLKDGLVKPVYEMKAGTGVDAIYTYEVS